MVTEAFWVSVAMLFYLSREKLWLGVETEGCLTSSNATKQTPNFCLLKPHTSFNDGLFVSGFLILFSFVT